MGGEGGSGGWGESEGSLSTSTVNRSFLIPHRSYETTTEKEEMNDDGGTLSDLWREERDACMLGRGGVSLRACILLVDEGVRGVSKRLLDPPSLGDAERQCSQSLHYER